MTSLAERIAKLVADIAADLTERERINEVLQRAVRAGGGERVIRDADGEIIETRKAREEN